MTISHDDFNEIIEASPVHNPFIKTQNGNFGPWLNHVKWNTYPFNGCNIVTWASYELGKLNDFDNGLLNLENVHELNKDLVGYIGSMHVQIIQDT